MSVVDQKLWALIFLEVERLLRFRRAIFFRRHIVIRTYRRDGAAKCFFFIIFLGVLPPGRREKRFCGVCSSLWLSCKPVLAYRE